MKKFLALVWIAASGSFAAQPAAPKLFDEVGSILKELSEITGLKPLKPVAHDTMDREQLKRYIQKKIREEVKPEEIRAEETVLKLFGFLPPDFNLEAATVELLTEQAAAFYDYDRKRLYIIDANSDAMQQMALVHELAHALADQHFRLEKFIKKVESADDASAARMAVMEGQASWLTFEYMARQMGRSLKDSPEQLRSMAAFMQSTAGQFPVLDKTPPYLRESLLFPYTAGMLFQQRVIEKLDKAGFAEVFKRPPVSTQQILHPEKYFGRVEPASPPLPAFPNLRGYRKLIEGSFGELDHGILLRQYCGKEAGELAAKWRGSRFLVMESRTGGKPALAYVSEWEDEAAAREFFDHYKRVLRGKWKKCEAGTEEQALFAGLGDSGRFEVRISGTRVTSLEGLPAEPVK